MATRHITHASVGVEERDDGTPVITGYAAVFYQQGESGTEFELMPGMVERIGRDAFTRAISEGDDVRGLFNHDPTLILGRTKAGTMRLRVDDRGLRYEIDPPNTQFARDAITSIRRGDVDGSSFSFNVRKEEFQHEEERAVRILQDVSLADVGPVSFPAYGSASSGIRALPEEIEDVQARLDRWDLVSERLQELKAR